MICELTWPYNESEQSMDEFDLSMSLGSLWHEPTWKTLSRLPADSYLYPYVGRPILPLTLTIICILATQSTTRATQLRIQELNSIGVVSWCERQRSVLVSVPLLQIDTCYPNGGLEEFLGTFITSSVKSIFKHSCRLIFEPENIKTDVLSITF